MTTLSATEDAQLVPKCDKNGRIYSRSKNAVSLRRYLESNPHVKEIRNAVQREKGMKLRARERALLAAELSDQPIGMSACQYSHLSKMGTTHQKGMHAVKFCLEQKMPSGIV